MKKPVKVLGVCVFLFSFCVYAAPKTIKEELSEINKQNKDLLQRVKDLEDRVQKSQSGVFDLGGGTTLRFNGRVRLRNESLHNAFDLDSDVKDNWNCTRLQTRLGFGIDRNKTLGAYVRLTNEYRWGQHTKYGSMSDPDEYDFYVDNAYITLDLNGLYGIPLKIKGGRQDIVFGEGWLVLDGTPYDGSATISFDAMRATWSFNKKNKLDFVFAKQSDLQNVDPSKNSFIGNMYSSARMDEDFYALYYTGTIPEAKFTTELYAMHRNKNMTKWFWSNFVDPELQTSVFGGRLSTKGQCGGHVAAAVEGCYQTGSITPAKGLIGSTPYTATSEVQRDAFGFYTWVKVNQKKELPVLKPELTLRFDYMSGDDPKTQGRYEGFDSMYAEWPKYSELLIYQLYDGFAMSHGTADPNLGAFSNMYFPTAKLAVTPKALDNKVTISGDYRYMLADEKNGPGNGRKMGDLYQVLVQYKIMDGLTSHFLFDYFDPDSYFAPSADDSWFARVQLMYNF